MKAKKVTVKIEIELLSIDALSSILISVIEQFKQEAESGELSMSDGDFIKWETTRKAVEF